MWRRWLQSKEDPIWINQCVTQCRLCSGRITKAATRLTGKSDAPRQNIAKMLATGKPLHIAAIEVTVLLRNQAMGEVYLVLQAYLGRLEEEARYLGSSELKVIPDEMAEPIASIVYASATKLGQDLPELRVLRQLMEKRYRKEFVADILYQPNSDWARCVSPSLRCDCLTGQQPTGAAKLKALKEIAEQHKVKWDEEAVRQEVGVEEEEVKPPATADTPAAAPPNTYACAPVPPPPPPPSPPQQQQQQQQQQQPVAAARGWTHFDLLPCERQVKVGPAAHNSCLVTGEEEEEEEVAASPVVAGTMSLAATGNPYACAPVQAADRATPKPPALNRAAVGGGEQIRYQGAAQALEPAGSAAVTPRGLPPPEAASWQQAAAAPDQGNGYARLPDLRHVASSAGDMAALGTSTGVTPPPRGWLLAAEGAPAGMPSTLLPPPALQLHHHQQQQQQQQVSPVLTTPGRGLASFDTIPTSSSRGFDRTSSSPPTAAAGGQGQGSVAAGGCAVPLRGGSRAAAAGPGAKGPSKADSMEGSLPVGSTEMAKSMLPAPAAAAAPPRLAMVGVGAGVGGQPQPSGAASAPGTPPAVDNTNWDSEMEELKARMEALRRM